MTPPVSVIVPVYNVNEYISRCAKSLFEQTLKNLEILFIDDCSPDNSIEIVNKLLESYPDRKNLTRIIRMSQNVGLAGVRSRGIIEAKGDYIIHCDGDDWVDSNLYETLYCEAIKNEADIVVCDEVWEYGEYNVLKPTGFFHENGKTIMQNWYRNTIGLFCHNKLVKKSIYTKNNILPWQGLNMWEDNGLFARLFYHADKVIQVKDGPLYHYNRANVNAMTSGYGFKQAEQMINVARNLEEFFEAKPDADDFKKTVDAFKYLARINLIKDSIYYFKRFKRTFPECKYIASELDPSAFSSKGRIRFQMVRHGFPLLFIVLFKIKNLFN